MGDTVLAALGILAVFLVVPGALWMLRRRARRRRIGGLMGPFDEIWHPIAQDAQVELRAQEERPAPSPVPGDRLIPGDPGRTGPRGSRYRG